MTRRMRMRIVAGVSTLAIFALIARRIALGPLVAAYRDADYAVFLALMVPNTIFYFCWDTLVLTTVVRWFHRDVSYREILPVRAASYVVGFFNTNAGRGAVAAYLWRRLDAPFLELSSTVIFLVLTEYTQLVLWAMLGLLGFQSEVSARLLVVAGLVAGFWALFFAYTKLHVTPAGLVKWILAPREWPLFRTFRLATFRRFAGIVLLRAPMFAVSLAAHYFAAHAFGSSRRRARCWVSCGCRSPTAISCPRTPATPSLRWGSDRIPIARRAATPRRASRWAG
jgi:hypothetical protein